MQASGEGIDPPSRGFPLPLFLMILQHCKCLHQWSTPPMADEPLRNLWFRSNQLHKGAGIEALRQRLQEMLTRLVHVEAPPGQASRALADGHCFQHLLDEFHQLIQLRPVDGSFMRHCDVRGSLLIHLWQRHRLDPKNRVRKLLLFLWLCLSLRLGSCDVIHKLREIQRAIAILVHGVKQKLQLLFGDLGIPLPQKQRHFPSTQSAIAVFVHFPELLFAPVCCHLLPGFGLLQLAGAHGIQIPGEFFEVDCQIAIGIDLPK
mmetsp:Transcript_74717/g.164978  ORF Transcript_74717/g.164978 Transcript_74717/m.164978 type:complete len:261 (-) Transcript_74717:202-984(-)